MVCTLLAGINVVAFAADDTLSVVCFYNDADKGGDGEHLFTKDEGEMSWLSSLPTWNNEGEAWKAPVSSSLAVYRCYNPNSGEHHYAAAGEAEWLVSQGWTQEKIAFYSDDNMGVPVYRLWNGLEGVRSHYYTIDEGEAAWLVSIGWQAEGVNFYGVKEEEPGEKEMVAFQSGAAEITVVSTTPFDVEDEFEVSHGLIEDSIEDIVFDDDMCTATITLGSNIEEATYLVECSDEEYEAVSFEGEEAEVTYFSFDGTQLVCAADAKSASIGFATLDQWLDPIEDDVEFTTAGYANESPALAGQGILTINAASGATLTVGTKVPVAAVYANKTKVENTTLEIVATSVVSNVQAFDLIVNPSLPEEAQEELAGKRITSARLDAGNYLLPMIVTDQYGNKLDADTLNAMQGNTFYVQNNVAAADREHAGIISAINNLNEGGMFFDGENGMVLLPVMSNPTKYGQGVLSFVSIGGFNTTKDINVYAPEAISTLNVAVGDLIAGQPTPVVFTAVDQYGDAIDLFGEDVDLDDTAGVLTIGYNGTEATAEMTDGIFTLGAGEYEGVIFATSDSDTGVDFITTKTVTSVDMKQVKVKAAAYAKSVKGLSDTAKTVIGIDNTPLNFKDNGSFVFLNQYGQVIGKEDTITAVPAYSPAAAQGKYTVERVTANDKAITEFNPANGTVSVKDGLPAAARPGKDQYRVTLYNADGSSANSVLFTVSVAGNPKTYSANTVADEGLLYVGAAGDAATIEVYGTDSAGNKYKIDGGYTLTVDSGLYVADGKIKGDMPKATYGEVTDSATVTVYMSGKAVATTDVIYSNADPVVMKMAVFEAENVNDPRTYTPFTKTEIPGLPTATFTAAVMDDCSALLIEDDHMLDEDEDPIDGSGYVIMAVSQYGLPVSGAEVTLMDSTLEGAVYNTVAAIAAVPVEAGDDDDVVIAFFEVGDDVLTFTLTGVVLDRD